MLGQLLRDVKFALRGLRREPTFAVTAILALAIGVATVTTTFSIADAELWKPLPYTHPDQLVSVYTRGPGARAQTDAISGADLVDWRATATTFAELAAVGRGASRRVLQLETAESTLVTEVSANYFSMLGRLAIAGRTFGPDDARKSPAAVLTDRAWHRLFAGDYSVVGRQLMLDDRSITIAGIVAADDSMGPDADLYLPIDESGPAFFDRTIPIAYGAIGRLQPGVGVDAARAQLQATVSRIAQSQPDGRTGHTVSVEGLREYFTYNNWRPLYFFLGGAIVVLILSTVNVATLLLSRAVRRTREFALRGALGAGIRTVARQLIIEGAVIAIPAAAAGLLATAWALRLFGGALPDELLLHGSRIPVDLRVALVALLLTAGTTTAFVLAPLLLARRLDLSAALGAGGRTGASAAEGRARVVLLTAQIALTVVLLSGAALFLRSFVALTHVPLGFDPINVIAVQSSLSGPRYVTDDQIRQYAFGLLDRAAGTPGIRDAAIASSSALGSGPRVRFGPTDRPRPAPADAPGAIFRAVTPSYFRTMAIAVTLGREFSDADVAGAPRVAIVNEQLATQTFPGENAVGKTIELLPGARANWTNRPGPVLIVGVASNTKEVGINEVKFSGIYVPFAQMPAPSVELVARTNVPSATLATTIRQRAASLDASIPVMSVTTFEGRLSDALKSDRFNMLLTLAFATVAVLLAALGVYGAVAYAVQARTREFGVRLAFGARPSHLVGSALWQAGRIGLIGGAIGLAVTIAVARLLGSALYLVPGVHNGLLYGVTTTDPVMLGCAFALTVAVAILAGAVPARRVAGVDPVQALRAE